MNTNHWTQFLIKTAGAILLLAAIDRILVAADTAPALVLPDPVLGIQLRIAVTIVGAIELAAAAYCLIARRTRLQLALIAWLSLNYTAFWIGAIAMGANPQGTAIGSLTDPLRLANGTLGHIITFIPPALLLASCAALILTRPKKSPAKPAPKPLVGPQKMTCPACGGHIRFDAAQSAQQIDCPHCKKPMTLRPPELLKTTCPQCAGHIEFPSHALGRKMPCPHCRADITLAEPP